MTSYTVHLTFAVPASTGRRERRVTTGRHESVTLIASGGELAAVVCLRDQESLAAAAVRAADLVAREWRLAGTGPARLLTWTASRHRVLAGLREGVDRAGGSGGEWPFGPFGPDDGGGAGVREPRRPLPGPPALGAELSLPE